MTDSHVIVEASLTAFKAFLDALPVIIPSAAAAFVTIWQANKKTMETAKETNQLLKANTDATVETSQKLDEVHSTVNGKNDALVAKLEDALKEITRLREELARRDAQ